MDHEFKKGVLYQTLNGRAQFESGNEHCLSFSHYGQETYPHVSHNVDGSCCGVDEKWRAFDIIGPLTTRPTITIEYGDDTGWVLKDGDKTADKMDPVELLSLVGALVLKTPLPCLRWLKTAEQREREEKHRAEQQAEREKERASQENVEALKKLKLDAYHEIVEIAALRGAQFGSPAEYVTWVKSHLANNVTRSYDEMRVAINDACDLLGIATHVNQGFVQRSATNKERFYMLRDAALAGKKAKETLAGLKLALQQLPE